jgi:hypothetical protein
MRDLVRKYREIRANLQARRLHYAGIEETT